MWIILRYVYNNNISKFYIYFISTILSYRTKSINSIRSLPKKLTPFELVVGIEKVRWRESFTKWVWRKWRIWKLSPYLWNEALETFLLASRKNIAYKNMINVDICIYILFYYSYKLVSLDVFKLSRSIISNYKRFRSVLTFEYDN